MAVNQPAMRRRARIMRAVNVPMRAALLLGILLLVAFDVFCLVRLAAADRVRFLPKVAWAVVIVFVNPAGGLVYLLSQHRPKRSPDSYHLFSGRA